MGPASGATIAQTRPEGVSISSGSLPGTALSLLVCLQRRRAGCPDGVRRAADLRAVVLRVPPLEVLCDLRVGPGPEAQPTAAPSRLIREPTEAVEMAGLSG
jgi:hypothetical protein